MTLTSTSPLDHPAYAGIAFAPRRYTVPGSTKTGTMFAPESWSQTAVTILATKYARRAGVPDATVKVLEDGIPEQFARSIPAENATFGGEADVRQVLHRLAGAWTYFGLKGRYFADEAEAEQFYSDALRTMIDQEGAPNSPQWFNTGLYFAYGISGNAAGYWYFDEASSAVVQSGSSYEKLAPMACFISTVEDSLVGEGGIFDWIATEARIFKLGAGSGANVSRLRAAGEKLAGGGTSSGLMSFLAVSDRAAGAIKSGGTTRRAAKMIVLDDDHPELPVFIAFKPKEEAKVAALIAGSFAIEKHVNAILAAAASKDLPEDGRLDPKRNTRLTEALRSALAAAIPSGTIAQAIDLANQGYSSVELDVHDSDWQGEAYMTIAGQNANISIGASDRFMRACDSRTAWTLRGRVDDSVNKDIDAGDLWDKLSFAAWQCADPGLLFLDTIDAWHTHHADGLIRSSNPCVTGETLISTDDGAKPIRDVVGKAAFVYGSDHKPHFVSKIFPTGCKPVYRLKTRAGYSINLTGDHRILTSNRGDVEAQMLTQDDKLILGKVLAGTTQIDPVIASAIGLAVGDGCVIRCAYNNRQLVLTMNHSERAILEPLASYFSQLKVDDSNPNRVRPVAVVDRSTSATLSVAYRPIVSEVERFAVLDEGSDQKAFRPEIYSLDEQSLGQVLRGLFTADGTVGFTPDKNAYVCLDSCSLKLIEQVQHLLLVFGIKSKIYPDRKPGNTEALFPDGMGSLKMYPVKPWHSLRISRSSRLAFEKYIGFDEKSAKADALKRLNSSVNTYKDEMVDGFLSLTYVGEEEVYDLTEPETSHFVANGIVVHNCGEYLAADGTACNLASINLVKFLHADGSFDVTRFEKACALWTLILEISVFAAHLPTAETALRTYQIRNLGLGYTSVGSLLMRLGLPYDSEAGRSYIAAITGLMTGVAYRTSRDIAKRVGPCESYLRNRESMQRVLRNHARAAGVNLTKLTKGFEGLNYEPYLPEPNLQSAPITARSIEVWGDVVDTEFEARNMQVTLCAPTGTISLVMDADTMGLEPDFALLKHKQLAGGGYIRIANESVNPALRSMGYSEKQVDDIIAYIAGTQTFSRGEAGIHRQALREHLSEATLDAADAALRSSFAIDDALLGALNESEQARFDAAEKKSVLESLGFSSEQIRKAQDVILGRGTIEGAPHLSREHLPVFDCAMPSGRGERCVSADGHLKMVAAVQPLISGAASKTINLPRSTSVKEIGDTYFKAWRLGLKGITVYRDGSKLSQPLSTSELGEGDMTTADAVREPLAVAERIVYRYIAKQRKLPDKRSGYTQKMTIAGDQKFFLRTGQYENGELGEIFLDAHKEGSAFRALLNNFAIAISMGLQHGVPLEEYVNAYTFTTFEPNGPVTGHAQIKMCKSLLDLVFRDLAVNYLGREDLAHVAMPDTRDRQAPMPEFVAEVNGDGLYGAPITNGSAHNDISHLNGHIVDVTRPRATSVATATRETTGNACKNCGSFDLVRSGTCETCASCGSTSGGCAYASE